MSGKRKNQPEAAASKKRKIVVEEDEEESQDQSDNEDEGNSDDSGSNSNSNSEDSENDDEDDSQKGSDEDEDSNDDNSLNNEEEEKPTKNGKNKKSAPVAKKVTKKVAKKAAKKVEKKKKSATKAKSVRSSSSSSSAPDVKEKKVSKIKSLRKSERLEEARKAYKWWEAPKLANGVNWLKLEHAGIVFAPAYVPHRKPLIYNGKPIVLTPPQEEVASFFAAIPADGPQLGNPKTKSVFEKNFFDDFKEVLGSGSVVQKFELCDFSAIKAHLDTEKNLRKAASDEEKLIKKRDKEVMMLRFGYALIDGRVEKVRERVDRCIALKRTAKFPNIQKAISIIVLAPHLHSCCICVIPSILIASGLALLGNYNMEPPGLFRGRGEHPKTGKLKSRCMPEQVSLNLSEDACVPVCTEPGHAWQSVQHDPSVTWLCAWNENVQNQNKYVMLAASSSFKGQSDVDKYSKAIKLKGCIDKVRRDYTKKIKQSEVSERVVVNILVYLSDPL